MPYNTPEYQAQAKIITRLNDEIRQLKERIMAQQDRYDRVSDAGEFYKQMQTLIIANPVLQEAWSEFIATMVLVSPEMKNWTAPSLVKSEDFGV